MSLETTTNKPLKVGLNLAVLLAAAWLLRPFFKIDASDYPRAGTYIYRLALGLMILIMYLGKLVFDVLSPQGLARKVSNLKTAAVLLFGLLIAALIIFIVIQAGALFLQDGASQDSLNF
ncbi:MAG: hypothetical protein JW742_05635 [Candidatus Aminicenantes bacterium]|nr:hypothetical protein [Candidatus Aminicenantes bacterium]